MYYIILVLFLATQIPSKLSLSLISFCHCWACDFRMSSGPVVLVSNTHGI